MLQADLESKERAAGWSVVVVESVLVVESVEVAVLTGRGLDTERPEAASSLGLLAKKTARQ